MCDAPFGPPRREGEVAPTLEDCSTGVDDNCDAFPTRDEELVWFHMIEPTNGRIDGATDDAQAVYVAGRFVGSSAFAGGTFSSADDPALDILLAKLDRNGTPLWAKAFGGGVTPGNGVDPLGIAVQSTTVALIGAVEHPADFGGGPSLRRRVATPTCSSRPSISTATTSRAAGSGRAPTRSRWPWRSTRAAASSWAAGSAAGPYLDGRPYGDPSEDGVFVVKFRP